MKPSPLFRLLLVACVVLASIVARAATPPPDNVNVHYKDPQNFTEAKRDVGVHLIDPAAYLKPFQAYIAQRASRILAPGQRLDIEVTDVDRAGEYEPWRGPRFNDVRIIKDIYPPRIDLDFTLYGADGKVLREGSRKLRDPAFLNHNMAGDQDSLRYEKSLIDLWLRRGTGKL
ncbi:hypothetical protein B0E46_02760 [Rhodanobacter sp. B04]|uniref:DUF3016 domain-containing protein n=1 Tax=Rhodanobacter sp. B04 TaxID=1945860 RepID=UPI000984BAF4|nr:DUF3016 domain-containing protein [Rhodanobacter sp. B04]OOG66403.1 hypothetical protein B0E46_02760 [Rhodanobacter sp. B04]